jgi:hypothetical protein
MQLGDDLTDQEEYYALLTQKLSKIKYDWLFTKTC